MAIAREIIVAKKEDPPAETRGSGTPVIGKSPRFMPIFTMVCVNRTKKSPDK
jgi:hypothetical protein